MIKTMCKGEETSEELEFITYDRRFIECEECGKDMQGVVEYFHDHIPSITCMKCYYKVEIKELKKGKKKK